MCGDDSDRPPDSVPGFLDWSRFVDRMAREVVRLNGHLSRLPAWRVTDGEGALRREFRFGSGDRALRFLCSAVARGVRSNVRVVLDFQQRQVQVGIRAPAGERLGEDHAALAVDLHASARRFGAERDARG